MHRTKQSRPCKEILFNKFFVLLPMLKSSKCFLFSHGKDTAVVKYTLLSSQHVLGAQVRVLDAGQSLLPSRRTFTRQRVTMQTAPATSCCPLEPHASSTALSQHLPTCIRQRTKYEQH